MGKRMGLRLIIVILAIVAILLPPSAVMTIVSMGGSDARTLKQSHSRPSVLQSGRIVHGMHPGGDDGQEDIIMDKPAAWYDYENSVGNRPAWIYFSQEWGFPNGDRSKPMNSHTFPSCIVQRISDRAQIPFIRLMLRSDTSAVPEQRPEEKETYFTLNNIIGQRPNNVAISEQINRDLAAWGRAARAYGHTIIVEWGTEVNGDTFSWNSQYNGPGGAKLFRQAFRHIVQLISGSDTGASNIIWVFHVVPEETDGPPNWNRIAQYYPDGTDEDPRDVIDWLGVSIYGAQSVRETDCESFAIQLQRALIGADGDGLLALANRSGRHKPILVLEMGTTWNYKGKAEQCRPEFWTRAAFETLLSKARESKQQIWGFSWWNERFPGDDLKRNPVEMRAQKNSRLAKSLNFFTSLPAAANAPDIILPKPDKSSCLQR